MKTYWRGTSIRVSKFRLWIASLIVPKKVRDCWDEQQKSFIDSLEESREQCRDFYNRYMDTLSELKQKESFHERTWLTQASYYSGVQLTRDTDLYLAKQAYKEGIGAREFLDYYRRAWGYKR